MKKRKKLIILGIAVIVVAAGIFFLLNGSGSNPNVSQAVLSKGTDHTKVLVIYFSRANEIEVTDNIDAVSSASLNLENGEIIGNTEIIAQEIAAATGADIYPIITENAYPANYTGTLLKAGVEMMLRSRPSLAGNLDSMDQYDVIFLGFPNWDGTLPMPVASFLEENDLSGKTIVPFVTHKGSGFGSSTGMIEDLASGADVYTDGWSQAGDNAHMEETRQDAAAWAETVLRELRQ